MTGPYTGDPELTPEQEEVIRQPAGAMTLVTAGAGSGKTYTLVRRLDQLVREQGLAAREILVLSFSRASVRELRNRLVRDGAAAQYVRTQTFDSWALELLTEIDSHTDWRSQNFEERIRAATKAIDAGDADGRYEEALRHVIIDEVQDLVGERREMVEALLGRYDCGFTVVGDSAQAIYGFQSQDPSERPGEFFIWLRNTFGEDLVELHLTKNFRARTEEARLALALGSELQRTDRVATSGPHLYNRLYTALGRTLEFGSLDDQFVCDSLRNYDGTSAILCRTNGQALLISEQLHKAGVTHRLQRAAQDRAVPAWVASLFRSVDASQLTRSQFDEVFPAVLSVGDLDRDTTWDLLIRHSSSRGGRTIDLVRLRSMLASGRIPDELTAQSPSQLLVSSFHRAKGLEFDRVLVTDPGPVRDGRNTDVDEEARMLYVAMTRPRDDLWRLVAPDTRFIRKDDRTNRWGRYHWQRSWRLGLELTGGDVHSDQPAGAYGFVGDPTELQQHLATAVLTGDELILERVNGETDDQRRSPLYLIRHGDRLIGAVSDRFRSAMYRYMQLGRGSSPRSWPALITGARVDAIETVVGSSLSGASSGLGPHGVWLAPRLTGLTWFSYEQKSREEPVNV
ncbi:UvrD-helicase domain-containing protein [Streptosporangium amethystogenes]|uniref:UvrD-helicase domain-containing protein n=1 Tax=Streptosporangium amethystogenes TaxID=2002 RepID=UPI0037A0FC52